MNELKQAAQARLEEMKAGTTRQGAAPVQQRRPHAPGGHRADREACPITLVRRRIVRVFERLAIP